MGDGPSRWGRFEVLLLRRLRLLRHLFRCCRLRHIGRPRRFGGRRGVRFRRSLGTALKGSLPPSLLFVHLPPSSRSSRNVRESKFTVRRTSRTPPSLPPPSSIPSNLFIYHSKLENHQSTAHTNILPAVLQPEDLLLPVLAERSRLLDHIPCRNHAGERVDARRPLQLRRLRQDGVGVRLIFRPAGLGD